MNEELMALLQAKEERMAWIMENCSANQTLICITANLAGKHKCTPQALCVVKAAEQAVRQIYPLAEITFCQRVSGYESLVKVPCLATEVKKAMCQLEMSHPLGRLMDLDVWDETGRPLSRASLHLPLRSCLLCKEAAVNCARSRKHRIEELVQEFNRRVYEFEKEQKYGE